MLPFCVWHCLASDGFQGTAEPLDWKVPCHHSGWRTRGVEFGGGGLHDDFGGFDSFGGYGEHLALLSRILQNTVPKGNQDGFDGLGRDGYPP